MYRTIVRRRVLHLFRQANLGNWNAIVDGLADTFTYRFIGDTPLGGTRTSKPKMRAWFERLYRLFPESQFHPQTIIVEGPPWNTQVMTYVKIRMTKPLLAGETHLYENEFMQLITIKWGKMTSVLTIEDTLRFANVLPMIAATGSKDATAEQITG
jgi:ketosteroid isomerase-like protein